MDSDVAKLWVRPQSSAIAAVRGVCLSLKGLIEGDVWQLFVLRRLSGTQKGCSSALLMAVIISKVTNAINMKNSLLITQLTLGLSSAGFNHHAVRINKHSILAWRCSIAQYNNQPINRWSDWTAEYIQKQFMCTRGGWTESFNQGNSDPQKALCIASVFIFRGEKC